MRQKLVLTQIYYYGTSFQAVRWAKGEAEEHHQTERKKKKKKKEQTPLPPPPQPTTLKRKGIVVGLYTNIKIYSQVSEDLYSYGWLNGFQFKTNLTYVFLDCPCSFQLLDF